MSDQSSPVSVSPLPTIDALHRDIAFANSYRLELIKLLMTLSAALLAFTVTFRPDLKQVLYPEAMWVGWFGLALSMLGGMVHMYGWDRFYMSFRDFDHKLRDQRPDNGRTVGKRKRRQINVWRRVGMCCQFGGFAVGVIGVAFFAGVNVDGKRHDESATSGSQQGLVASSHAQGKPATVAKGEQK